MRPLSSFSSSPLLTLLFRDRHIISNHFLLSTLGGLSLFVVLFGAVHTLYRSTISPGNGAGEEHLAKWTFALWPVAYAVAWLLRCVAHAVELLFPEKVPH